MAETITLPGFGPVKKQTAYVAGAGLALVAGVAWYRSKNAPAADVQPTDSSPINPATGFPYGSAEDANALAAQGFSYSGGAPAAGGPSGDGGAPTGGGFTTNAQWSQAAEDYLVNTVGMAADVVGNALGKYITGQAISGDQAVIVQQAIAFTGYPPVNGPAGYPPSYRTAAETPPPGSGGGKPGKVGGLHAANVTTSSIRIAWTAVAGATGYHVYSVGASGWQSIGNATSTSFTRSGLKRGTRYRFKVAAYNAAGTGPQSAELDAATHH